MSSSSPHERLSSISSHIMGSSNASVFTAATVAAAPEDPLFGLMKAYREDPSDKKVDLGIGAYRDNNAKPWILPVVKKADNAIHNDPSLNHEYLSIGGLADFTSAAQKLIVGADSAAIKEKRVRPYPATNIPQISPKPHLY
jgi:aspartate aminotransferase